MSVDRGPEQMDVERARQQMIQQQIRAFEVLDPRILELFEAVPRERFVPEAYRRLAFADTRIPLAHGECMMTPTVEGRLLQALDVDPGDEVLEIGTGSGFLTACLATLGGHVRSLEIHPELSEGAAQALKAAGVHNAALEVGDGVRIEGGASYDVIVATGAVAEIHPSHRSALALGGRLFVVTGEAPVMHATLVTRVAEDDWATVRLFETELPYLRGGEPARRFSF